MLLGYDYHNGNTYKTNVKKKDGKRFGAIILSLILLLSLVFPYPVMADQTAADQTTAASVYAIHKTGDDAVTLHLFQWIGFHYSLPLAIELKIMLFSLFSFSLLCTEG